MRYCFALAVGVGLAALVPIHPAYAASAQCLAGIATIERLPTATAHSGEGHTFGLLLDGSDEDKAPLDLRLFVSAGGAGYVARFSGVSFHDPGGDGRGSLVSKVLAFSLPSGDDIDVAAVTAENHSGRAEAACAPVDVYVRGTAGVVGSFAPWLHGVVAAAADKSLDGVRADPLGAHVCELAYMTASTMSAVQPQLPASAIRDRAHGVVQVRVRVAADGSLTSANVYKSSGRADLDEAARKAAVATLYRPAIDKCTPVAGDYLFVADFLASRP